MTSSSLAQEMADQLKLDTAPVKSQGHLHKTPAYQRKTIKSSVFHARETDECAVCNQGQHRIYQCPTYRGYSVERRFQTTQRLHLCHNCLGVGHAAKDCPSSKGCKERHKRHHTTMHRQTSTITFDRSDQASGRGSSISSQHQSTEPESDVAANPHHASVSKSSRLHLCCVAVRAQGRTQSVRALLDAGSTTSFMTSRLHNTI